MKFLANNDGGNDERERAEHLIGERGEHLRYGQRFERKDDALDQVGLVQHDPRRAGQYVGEQVEDQQAGEQLQHEFEQLRKNGTGKEPTKTSS